MDAAIEEQIHREGYEDGHEVGWLQAKAEARGAWGVVQFLEEYHAQQTGGLDRRMRLDFKDSCY